MSRQRRPWICSLPQVYLSLVSYGLRKWPRKVSNKLKIVFSRVENLLRTELKAPDFFKLRQHIDVVITNQQTSWENIQTISCLDKQLGRAQVNFSQAKKASKYEKVSRFKTRKASVISYGERFDDILILIWLDVNKMTVIL